MGSNIRVLFLTGSLETGGLERFVSQVSLYSFHRQTFMPSVLCLSQRSGIFLDELEANGIPVLAAPPRWQRSLTSLVKLGRVIKEARPTVVHSQVNFSLFQQWLAVRLFSSAKFLVTERNCYPLKGAAILKRIIQFHFLRLMGVQYSGNSGDVAKYLGKIVFYPVQKIPVIPNGIDLPSIDQSTRDRLRKGRGWAEGDFVIGYVARFAEHKGHSYFVRVLRYIYRRLGSNLKVCFIGEGPLRGKIEKEIAEAGMSNICVFLGAINNVGDYYQAFDCTSLLSDYEGMPNVVIEGMAHGLPVVANPVGNVRELFSDGGGVLNLTADPEDTSVLFLDLASSSSRRASIGSLARHKIDTTFSMQNTIRLLNELYVQ